uniref:Uncharacterized protein n=1 Tax=Ciona savignyi TaxID=51511 RepID=H2YG26_CIOSA
TKPLQAPGEQQYYNTIHPTTRHEDEMKQRILLNHYTMHETHTDPLDY